jgi:hypothetical protein
MIRTLRAVEFIRPMEVGSKHPALFLCHGGNGDEEVVVKFRETLLSQQFSCVGEVIAALLARDLGLQAAEPVLVSLCSELAATTSSSAYGSRIERSEGWNYGSVFAGPGMDACLPTERDSAALKRYWADLFCFDFLIQNYDRVSSNPNYLKIGENVILIDHEQAFRDLHSDGSDFSVNAMNLDRVFTHVAFPVLDSATNFRPFFSRFSALPETRLEDYFAPLPESWLDTRTRLLGQYLHWAQRHATELCERLTSILES